MAKAWKSLKPFLFALGNDGTGHVRITDPVLSLFAQAMAAVGDDEGNGPLSME